jgi:uncharacterized protein (DUF362 family)
MNPTIARNGNGVSRRDVLKGLVAGLAASVVRPGLAAPEEDAIGKARIIRVECDRLWRNDRRDPEALSEMLDRGLTALTGKASGGEAWKSLLGPCRRVGLKINLLGRPRIYTAPEIAEQATAGLVRAGFEGSDIVVWDRPEHHFRQTAFKLGRGRFGESIEGGGSYAFRYKDDRSYVATSACGLLPVDLIPLTRTEATINLPVIKDHELTGVTGALKNIAFGCFHTTPQCHDDHCDPFIAEAYEHFLKVNPVPLIILDATEGCFEGGPVPDRASFIWRESALYFASDPVALDRVAGAVIARKRKAAGLADVTPMTRHIDTAAAKKLGQGDPGKIEEIVVRV